MNRRQFIASLGAVAAAAALAPLETLAPAEREAWLNETLRPGDVIEIASVYAINPVTGRETPSIKSVSVVDRQRVMDLKNAARLRRAIRKSQAQAVNGRT